MPQKSMQSTPLTGSWYPWFASAAVLGMVAQDLVAAQAVADLLDRVGLALIGVSAAAAWYQRHRAIAVMNGLLTLGRVFTGPPTVHPRSSGHIAFTSVMVALMLLSMVVFLMRPRQRGSLTPPSGIAAG